MPPVFVASWRQAALVILPVLLVLLWGVAFFHCFLSPPVPPHLHKAAVVELAREWLQFATHCRVFFWIDYGSLLAAVRDNGEMMPWDHDADFSMLHSDLAHAMQRASYFDNTEFTLALHPTPRAGLRLSKRNIYIDIFGFDQDPEAPSFLTRSGRWHTIWGSSGPKENFPRYFVQPPLVNVTFEGMVFPAPHNAGLPDASPASEPSFLEYFIANFARFLSPISRNFGSYRYHNWRVRPDASHQSSDSGITFVRERVCYAPSALWGCVLMILIALMVFLRRRIVVARLDYSYSQVDHKL